MRCPYCDGTVFEVGSGLANNGTAEVEAFWKGDAYHTHNPNRLMTEYRCSRGHHWKVTLRHGCPAAECAWNKRVHRRTVRLRGRS